MNGLATAWHYKNMMMKSLFRMILLLVMAVGLAACESSMRVQKLPELTFTHLGSINLNVKSLDVASKYKMPLKRPNVEHLMPVQPVDALKRWAKDRLTKVGASATARFTVYEASVIEQKLKLDSSFTGLLTKQQSERYTAKVEAVLEIFDSRGIRRGHASANAVYSQTVREDATLNEREKVWFSLVESVMRRFDTEMTKNIKRYLVNWIK